MTRIVYDEEIRSQLSPRDAVRWMGEAIDAHYRGALVAPARVHADLGAGQIVFTAGHLRGSWFGYRSYDTFRVESGSQISPFTMRSAGTSERSRLATSWAASYGGDRGRGR